MMSADLQIGWIGLGSMGLAMATNIQRYLKDNNLPALKYWNRTIGKGAHLAEMGASPSVSIAALAQGCDVVFISVSDDEALQNTTEEILKSGDIAGKIIADTTTVHPSTSTSVSDLLHSSGAHFLAAPVFGATPLAQSGRLLMAIAGSTTAIQTISPYLKNVIARNVIQVGPKPEQALLLKTTSNFITAGLMYLISEAHVLAEKCGLPSSVLESLIQENFGSMAYSDSQRMTGGIYYPAAGAAPYSDLDLGIKDVGHGMSIAENVGMELRIGELAMESMLRAKRVGEERGRRLDSSSMFGVVRMDAGLEFETEGVKKRDSGEEIA